MKHKHVLLAVALIAIGLAGVSLTSWFCPSCNPARMMRMMGQGMMDQAEMKDMMQQMMGSILPPGIKAEDLPDSESPGARLLVAYCDQCHALPSPGMHAAEDWPRVAGRMFARMRMMGGMQGLMMDVNVPTSDEEKVLLRYLQSHSLKSLSPFAIPSPASSGAILFQQACSQCHALPDPMLHTSEEWPAVIARMRLNMVTMGKAPLSDLEAKNITEYLRMHART